MRQTKEGEDSEKTCRLHEGRWQQSRREESGDHSSVEMASAAVKLRCG